MNPARITNGVLEPDPVLTSRQMEALIFLWKYYGANRQYPSLREMATGMGAPISTVVAVLEPLVKKGVAAKAGVNRARNIRITELGVRILQAAGVAGTTQLELGQSYGGSTER